MVKDERLKIQTELLGAVKMVKIYAWEETVAEKVREIRDRELALQLKSKLYGGIQWMQFSIAPTLVGAACFFVYCLVEKQELN